MRVQILSLYFISSSLSQQKYLQDLELTFLMVSGTYCCAHTVACVTLVGSIKIIVLCLCVFGTFDDRTASFQHLALIGPLCSWSLHEHHQYDMFWLAAVTAVAGAITMVTWAWLADTGNSPTIFFPLGALLLRVHRTWTCTAGVIWHQLPLAFWALVWQCQLQRLESYICTQQ